MANFKTIANLAWPRGTYKYCVSTGRVDGETDKDFIVKNEMDLLGFKVLPATSLCENYNAGNGRPDRFTYTDWEAYKNDRMGIVVRMKPWSTEFYVFY